MGKFIEEMAKAGVLLATEGCLPSSKGARVRLAGGKLSVTDGPFAEAKELIGGYAIAQVKSKEEAVQMGHDFMKLHGDILWTFVRGRVRDSPDVGVVTIVAHAGCFR